MPTFGFSVLGSGFRVIALNRLDELQIGCRTFYFLILFMLVLSLIAVSISADKISSQAAPAKLTLVPSFGFSTITVVGTGFFGGSITISWDGDPIPTVPSPLFTSDTQLGMFTAIISVQCRTFNKK